MNLIEVPSNARSRRTRAAVLDATRAILEEQGFDALTMAAVATRAGVSRRAIYLHFTSRAELVSELFDHVAVEEGLTESLRRVWDAPDCTEAVRRWADHVARQHARTLAVERAVERVHHDDADIAAHRDHIVRRRLTDCRKLATRIEHERRLRSPWTIDTAGDMLWALMSTDIADRLLVRRRWTEQRFALHLAEMLRSTLLDDTSLARSRQQQQQQQ